METASKRHQQALESNPNDSLAWLYTGITHAFLGQGKQATLASKRALNLSPLDPLKYYYCSLSASAHIAAGEYELAIEMATASLRLNRTHTSTLRALAIAQAMANKIDAAKKTVLDLLKLEPKFNAQMFLERYPGRVYVPEYAQQLADSLVMAGLPEH
jgi:adenylate cyclase